MKKQISLLLIMLLLCTALAACTNKEKPDNSDSAESTDVSQNSVSGTEGNTDIKITDTFSITDPEGVVYEKRHICVGDENCTMVQGMAMQGYKTSAVYVILYENEGKAVGEYQVIVCESEEDANNLKEFYAAAGQTLMQEGTVLYTFSDADTIQGMIAMYAGMGAFSGESVEAYLGYLSTANGLTEQ